MESIWSKTVSLPPRQPLFGDRTAEVAVIGAGMAGILTAYFLQEAGLEVVVLEADRTAGGQTKNTTAKLTSQQGMIYHRMIRELGMQKARLYARSQEGAIRAYEELVSKEHIDCHFCRLPSYLYGTNPGQGEASAKKPANGVFSEFLAKKEAAAAASLGLPARFTTETGLPFPVSGAVRFDRQAQFHPLEFIKPLAEQLTIFEKTRVQKVKQHRIITDRGTVTARHIVFACHYPFVNFPGFYLLRQHQERSYVLALSGARLPEYAMYYGIGPNGFSMRRHEDLLLFGGCSHRTGKNGNGQEYEKLLSAAKRYFPDCTVQARWSAQDCMPHDRLPFIGPYSALRPYWHVATGFQKWGMTNSMVAALLLRDQICGLPNPYEALFRPQRCLFGAAAKNLWMDLGENTRGILKGTFHLPWKEEHLMPGQGKIIRIGWKRYACYKDEAGVLHKSSARCPHFGCELSWNPAEKTWDCPCHGSRFDYDGNLIDNPAQTSAARR